MSIAALFKKKKKISVNVKLLAGLDKIEGYDPEQGLELEIRDGTKLKKALQLIKLPTDQPLSFMVNGNKVGSNTKLKNGDEVFCFLPFAGG